MNMKVIKLSQNKLCFALLCAWLAINVDGLKAAQTPAIDVVAAVFARDQSNVADTAEVLAFTQDVDGDGIGEQFVTLANLRNGRRGNIWTVYSGDPANVRILGEAQFPPDFVVPFGGDKQNLPKGLYSYWPGGQQKGRLSCYTLIAGEVVEKDLGEIEPHGKDKTVFESIFGDATHIGKPVELKSYKMRELMAMPMNTSLPPDAKDESQTPLISVTPGRSNSSVQSPSVPESPSAKPLPATPSEEPTLSTPWSIIMVLIMAGCSLLWLLLKRRS